MPRLIYNAGYIFFIGWIPKDKSILVGIFRKPRIYSIAGAYRCICVNVNGKTKLMFACSRNSYPFFRQLFSLGPGISFVSVCLYLFIKNLLLLFL